MWTLGVSKFIYPGSLFRPSKVPLFARLTNHLTWEHNAGPRDLSIALSKAKEYERYSCFGWSVGKEISDRLWLSVIVQQLLSRLDWPVKCPLRSIAHRLGTRRLGNSLIAIEMRTRCNRQNKPNTRWSRVRASLFRVIAGVSRPCLAVFNSQDRILAVVTVHVLQYQLSKSLHHCDAWYISGGTRTIFHARIRSPVTALHPNHYSGLFSLLLSSWCAI